METKEIYATMGFDNYLSGLVSCFYPIFEYRERKRESERKMYSFHENRNEKGVHNSRFMNMNA